MGSYLVHLGVGNLNVVRHVPSSPALELEDDGDFICLIRKMIRGRGEGTACISKVKGHAEEVLVRNGQVRELDRDGNNEADEAADFGRRRVWPDIIGARRDLSGVPSPVLLSMPMVILVLPLIL